MSIMGDLNNIGDNHALIFVSVFAMLAPGTLATLIFFPTAIQELDIFKLILIFGGFGVVSILPLYGTLIAGTLVGKEGIDTKDMGIALLVASTVIVGVASIFLQLLFYLLLNADLKVYLLVHALIIGIIIPALFYSVLVRAKK